MADKPKAHIVHRTPSRVRLRIPERRQDKAYFLAASQTLESELGVRIETNPTTGSILVISENALAEIHGLGDRSPFVIVDERPENQLSLPVLRQQAEIANARFSRLLGGDARGYLILGLIIMSCLQIFRPPVKVMRIEPVAALASAATIECVLRNALSSLQSYSVGRVIEWRSGHSRED